MTRDPAREAAAVAARNAEAGALARARARAAAPDAPTAAEVVDVATPLVPKKYRPAAGFVSRLLAWLGL